MSVDPERFATEVLLPLATGGPLIVRAPYDADDVSELERQSDAMPGIAQLAEVRRAVVTRYLCTGIAPSLDSDAIRLACAIHNLCWLLRQPKHEEPRGPMIRVAAYTEHLCKLRPPADEIALLGRHALVGRLHKLTRRDVLVRFWAGHAEYRGEAPPRRLLRWQRIRRVREEESSVDLFSEALAAPPTRAIVIALLGASPFTDLLGVERADPPINLYRGARWLRSRSIARALADEYLQHGLAAIEPAMTTALVAVYNAKGAAAEATTSTAFHSHLHLLDLVARPPRDREGHLQVIRGYVQGRERGAADGFGLVAAADRVGLGRPGDAARDRALSRNIDAYVEACAELVGQRRLLELTGMVARGAGNRARVA
jgi:hypothetical protein